MSKQKLDALKDVSDVLTETQKVEELLPHHVPDPVVTGKKKLGKTRGVVAGCNALRLRLGASLSSHEMTVIPAGAEIIIDLDNSTLSFYEATYTTPERNVLVGFCLKEFVQLIG